MLSIASSLHAQTVVEKTDANIGLLNNALYLVSPANTIEAEQLITQTTRDKLTPAQGKLSFGYGNHDVWLWIKLVVQQDQQRRLIIKPSFLDRVEVYHQNPVGDVHMLQAGDHVPVSQRPLPSRYSVFPLSLSQGDHLLLVRIQSTSALTANLALKTIEQHMADESNELLFFGVLFGLLSMALMISLMSAFWTRDVLFVYSSVYLLVYAILNATLNGFDQLYFYPEFPQISGDVIGLASGSVVIALTLFMNQYLQLHIHKPTLYKWLVLHMVLASIVIAASLTGQYPLVAPYFMWLSLSVLILLFFGAISMLRVKPQAATLMIITFLPSILAIFFQVLRNVGALPTNFWTSNLWSISSFLQVAFVVLVILIQLKQLQEKAFIERKHTQALRHFLDLMAHELRTPLAVLSSALTNIEIRSDLNKDLQPRFARAHNALARLNNLVDNALAESRLSSQASEQNREIIDLDVFINDLMELVTPSSKHSLSYRLTGDEVTLTAHRQMLSLALLNLIDNAIKYSPDGGPVLLAVNTTTDSVCFTVRDNGIGIPASEQANLFNKFFRASNASRTDIHGLGMGLYLVQQVAELHHGTLRYKALPNGSEFLLTIPKQR